MTIYTSSSPGPPYCLAIYYINSDTKMLQALWTGAPAFVTTHGTKVGMTASEVQTREGQQVSIGSHEGIFEGDQSTVAFVYINLPSVAAPLPTDQVRDLTADVGIGLLSC